MTTIDEPVPRHRHGRGQLLEYKESTWTADLTGAGDQGMMFGYACDETPKLMPAAHRLAHQAGPATDRGPQVRQLALAAARRQEPGHRGVRRERQRPVRIDAVVISTQHDPDIAIENSCGRTSSNRSSRPTLPAELLDENTKFFVNPTGRFVVGGPVGDSGLTGRKIIVDTYGGYCRPRRRLLSPARTPPRWTAAPPTLARSRGQEHCRCRPCQEVPNRAGLRHRRGQAASPSWSTPTAPAWWPTRSSRPARGRRSLT